MENGENEKMRNRMKFFFFPTYDIIPGLGFGGKRPIVEERDGDNREKRGKAKSQVSDDSYDLLCFHPHIHDDTYLTLHSEEQTSRHRRRRRRRR